MNDNYLEKEKHFTIIGDFIDSKKIVNRYEIQETLKKKLNSINRKYKDDITSVFSIGKGDEFQANLNKIDNIILIIHEIMSVFSDVDIRFGIGYGTLKTKFYKTTAFGSDGEAWYLARQAIDEIKEHNDKNPQYQFANYRFRASEGDALNIDFLNGINNNNFLIYIDWTKTQRNIANVLFENYGLDGDFIQKEAAKKIKTSSQNLNKTLQSMNYYYYINFLKLVNDEMRKGLS
ncbi:MAG: SatD family protein [Tenericutes bacterium]|jgi:hypothetical protein|nr:SatD family protein [Mycoplasmatota bacterium]